MNCPHCQSPLADDPSLTRCPACNGPLPWNEAATAKTLPPVKFSFLWFWPALLAAPLLTLLSALLFNHTSNDGISVGIGFFGSVISGIASGVILGLKLGRTIPGRVILSIIFAGIFFCLCLFLSCVGCSVGGYHMDFR